MELKKANKSNVKIKMALIGESGTGKTMSSLLLGKELSNDVTKVAIVDTEQSAHLYSNLFDYQVLSLKPPFTTQKYIEALTICEQASMEVIIIDNLSFVWEELLDYHSKLSGTNSFSNWRAVKLMHKALIDKILQMDAHIIATIRKKQGYILTEKNGKLIPEKIGLKPIQSSDISFDFSIVFDMNNKYEAKCIKNRTSLFDNSEFIITEKTGQEIKNWLNNKVSYEDLDKLNLTAREEKLISSLTAEIQNCNSLAELLVLYKKQDSQQQEAYRSDFEFKKNQLFAITNPQNILNYENQPH